MSRLTAVTSEGTAAHPGSPVRASVTATRRSSAANRPCRKRTAPYTTPAVSSTATTVAGITWFGGNPRAGAKPAAIACIGSDMGRLRPVGGFLNNVAALGVTLNHDRCHTHPPDISGGPSLDMVDPPAETEVRRFSTWGTA